jgi:hypothetical protein
VFAIALAGCGGEGDEAQSVDVQGDVVANDAGYDIPEIAAGEQTIELRDADDREREFFLVALKPGTDIDDLDQFFEQGEKGLPPAQFHGAMQTIPQAPPCSSTSISRLASSTR